MRVCRQRRQLCQGLEPENGRLKQADTRATMQAPQSELQATARRRARRIRQDQHGNYGAEVVEVKLIKTEADYREALTELAPLVDRNPAPDALEGDRLEILKLLVEAYEKKHHPMELPTAIEAIDFQMDQRGLTPADMVEYFGHRSWVTLTSPPSNADLG